MKRRLLLALLAAGLVAPAPASAQFSFPDQRPAPYKTWDLVNGWARPFWADRNVRACEDRPITVWVVNDLTQQDGTAWGRGWNCEIWLQADLVTIIETKAPRRHASWADRRQYRLDMIDGCTVAFHETGHALGLPHSATGLMAGPGVVPPYFQAWAPYECRLWARAQVTFN